MIELREYQKKAISLSTEKLKNKIKKILIWMPTGSGKGLVMASFVDKILRNKKKILTVMRRRDLIFQTYKNYKKYYNIESSIIIGNEKGYNPENNSQIASIDTLRNRIKKSKYNYLKKFDVIIIDEAHDTTSLTYKKLFNFLGEKIYLGFTATPFSISGKPLYFWDDYISPIRADELVEKGFLVDFEIYAPFEIDTSKISIRNGEFDQMQLSIACSEMKVIGSIVDNWKIYGKNRKTICFGVNKDHSKLICREFNENNIPAIHCDESTNKSDREKAINDFKKGKYKILCNVNIFSTGVDIPEASCGIMARPTKSEVLYIQQIGRLSRPFQGKNNSIILDHGGNCSRHGHPYYEERIPCINYDQYLEKKNKKETTIPSLYRCKNCFFLFNSVKNQFCPDCGTEKEKRNDLKIVDGELIKITFKKKEKWQVFLTKLEKLKELAYRRGYKSTWAYFELHKRCGDIIFNYEKKLKLPSWLKSVIKKQSQKIDFEQFLEENQNEKGIIGTTFKINKQNIAR